MEYWELKHKIVRYEKFKIYNVWSRRSENLRLVVNWNLRFEIDFIFRIKYVK